MYSGRARAQSFSFITIAMVIIGGLYPASLFAQDPPNIIVILTDDQGMDAIEGSFWSNDLDVNTPLLASFASQGRVFRNARVNPKCSPTRAGLMTGRSAFRTGVTGVVNLHQPTPDRDLVSLASTETTIAEILDAQGYYNILIDKWHIGWLASLGQQPVNQGFHLSHNYMDSSHLDDPVAVGDEHLTRSVNQAVTAVQNRPDPNEPYSVFFWSIDPHRRVDQSGREPLLWWKVDSSLHPSGEDYYADPDDSNLPRYRAVVEAMDTEIGRMLRELGVTDENNLYDPASNTIVFFLSDNGTPGEVAMRPERSKGTLYEGGVRVPFFVFGAGVPSDGLIIDRQVTHTDIYDTICDIVEVDPAQRGDRPRDSFSFADDLGYTGPGIDRVLTMCSEGNADPKLQRVSLTDGQYKLITPAGSTGLASLHIDEFYDIVLDPGEDNNLVGSMTTEQYDRYIVMRDEISSHWPSSVARATEIIVDIPSTHVASLDSTNAARIDGFAAVGLNEVSPGTWVRSRMYARFDIESWAEYFPPDKDISDVVDAQIVLSWESDTPTANATESGVISAFPATTNWWNRRRSWDQLESAFLDQAVGSLDIAPHVIPSPAGNKLSGMPLERWTPISLGHSDALVTLVNFWVTDPNANHGIALLADQATTPGDQRILVRVDATLRLTIQ